MYARRRWRAVLGIVVSLAALAACGAPAIREALPPGPANILLVNDEGPNAPGLVVLRDTLRRAGHTVTVVAPAARRDDAGMATTTSGDFRVRRPTPQNPNVWTVDGTPADAALVGMRAVLASNWPEIVIAGINTGPTVGLSTMQSGGVGAAMTAAANSIPAMAVSTDVADRARPRPEEFRRTADFVARMITVLQQQRTNLLLMPPRTVLNVNYPGGEAEDVTVAPTAPVPSTSMFYRAGRLPGTYTPAPVAREAPGGDNDVTALRGGDVVLTDLSADPDRSAAPPRVAARLAPALRP